MTYNRIIWALFVIGIAFLAMAVLQLLDVERGIAAALGGAICFIGLMAVFREPPKAEK